MFIYLNRKAALTLNLQHPLNYSVATLVDPTLPFSLQCMSRTISPLCLKKDPSLALATTNKAIVMILLIPGRYAELQQDHKAEAPTAEPSDRVGKTKQISGKTDSQMPILV